MALWLFFFFQAEDGIRDDLVTGVQTCALPISASPNTEVEFVVLVAPERLVEQADASKHVRRERAEREGVRLDSRRPVAGARPTNAEHAGDPAEKAAVAGEDAVEADPAERRVHRARDGTPERRSTPRDDHAADHQRTGP